MDPRWVGRWRHGGRRAGVRDIQSGLIEQLEARSLLTGLVELDLAPLIDLDGNGLVVAIQVVVVGRTKPSAWVGLDQNADGKVDRLTRAGGDGRFQFKLRLKIGDNVVKARAWANGRPLGEAALTVTHADAVLNWNATALATIRSEGTPPPVAARALGMTHVAMHDAFQAVARHYQPIAVSAGGPACASARAAASQAAFEVLSSLYPDQRAVFEASLQEALAVVPDGKAQAAGIKLGTRVGQGVLAARANDGSDASVTYVPGTQPGQWVPTPAAYAPPLLPQWGYVQPLGIASVDDFSVADFPALTSEQYAAEFEQVKQYGRTTDSARTDDQTAIAHFWANGAGTFTPPGHWNQIATQASLARRLSFAQNIRLFAMLDAALCDAGIVAWNIKYDTSCWRPVTAIQEASGDGNNLTEAEPGWTPLLNTPPFPTYVSGHSTFSGAAQAVLDHFVGPHYAFTAPGDPTEGLPERSFSSFREAAEESGISRIYGGIHFQADNVEGLRVGRAVGLAVLQRFRRT